MAGPPGAGKSRYLYSEATKSFRRVESDQLFRERKNWTKAIQEVRRALITSPLDTIVEINPLYVWDLVDVVIVFDATKPLRRLTPDETTIFEEWQPPEGLPIVVAQGSDQDIIWRANIILAGSRQKMPRYRKVRKNG